MISARVQHAVGRVAIGRHHQHRVRLDEHRLAGVRVEDVGEELLRGVDVRPIDEFLVGQVDPGAVVRRSVVGVVGRPLPLVVVHRADHQVDQPLFLVQPEDLAHFRRPLQDQVRAVEEDRLAGDRDDEPVLGRRGGLDVVFARGRRWDRASPAAPPPSRRGRGRCRESSRRRSGWGSCSPASRRRTPPACTLRGSSCRRSARRCWKRRSRPRRRRPPAGGRRRRRRGSIRFTHSGPTVASANSRRLKSLAFSCPSRSESRRLLHRPLGA